jgi:hypothetical protein
MGLRPGHCASARQPTQVPAPTSHIDVAPAQALAFVAEQAPHEPSGWHAGLAPPHWPSFAHAPQVCVPGSQAGLVAPHWAAVAHVSQMPSAVSQVEVGPVQAVLFVAEQTPHAPVGWQAGVPLGHWASLVHATQACVPRSHTGVLPWHWASLVHATHAPVAASHVDFTPPQRSAFVAEHWPQAPEGWQAGVAGPHCASLAHG